MTASTWFGKQVAILFFFGLIGPGTAYAGDEANSSRATSPASVHTYVSASVHIPASAYTHIPATVHTLTSSSVSVNSPSEQFQKARALFDEGFYAEAYSLFRQLSDDLQPSESLGSVQASTGSSAKAGSASIRESAAYYAVLCLAAMERDNQFAATDRFLRLYPNSRYAAELLKDAAFQEAEQGRFDEAVRRAAMAVTYPQTDKERAEAYFRLAEYSIQADDPARARNTFLELADRFPYSTLAPKALYARGTLYLEDEQYQNATDAFELLRERFPYDEMTRRIGTALGESYYRQKKYALAIEAFEDQFFYLDDELQRKAIYLMAESANAMDDLKNAARLYRMLLNRTEDPEEQRLAHYGLGWIYHKQEIWHWAADSFGKAADMEAGTGADTNASPGANTGISRDTGIPRYTGTPRDTGTSPENGTSTDLLARKALYYKAVNHKLAGQFPQALETFRTFGSRFRDGEFLRHAYFEWAVTAFEAGFYGEAIEALLPLARQYETIENSGEILSFLGEVYYANQEYSRAVETFELASSITDIEESVKRQAKFQMAWLRYSNQSYERAKTDFEAVVQEWPDSDLGREALFWSADSRYRLEEYGPASVRYERFIRENPEHELTGPAKYALGWAHFMMGEFDKTTAPLIDFLENYEPPSIALYPYETDTQLRIGDAFYAQGNYPEAIRYYRKAIGAEPGGDYAIYQLANSYYRQNRNFDAVTQFRRMIRIYPFSRLREQSQYNIAYIYLSQGNYDQAIEEFRRVIERYPGTEWAARSQYNIGDAHYNAGDYAEAIAAYQVVLQEYPKSRYVLEAVDGIQYSQLSAGDEDQSTDLLEAFLNENPTSETADRLRFRQAVNTLQTGNYEAAVREFRQYLRITNNQQMMPEAYFNMADAYLRLGNKDAAALAYETIASEYPQSERTAPSLAELGLIELGRGRLEEAADVFTRLAELDRRFHQEAFVGRGNAFLGLGRMEEAEADFRRVTELQAGNDAARIGLSRIALQRDQPEEAIVTLEEIAAGNSTELGAEAQYLLGESQRTLGNREAALEEYRKVMVLFEIYDRWVSMARYRMAEIFIRQGKRTDALNLLREIIETYPGTEGAENASALLERT